jgi:preprotein translocase subunit SecA
MAGRGTDIKLGEGVRELGGLRVIGTERHESRRIDRQLIGRCSRQGDPGSARFYISLEDDLMRLFANAGPISRVLEKTFQEGDVLEHPLINRSIGSAQKKVEDQNFAIRKRLLQYDNVLNKQREVIYGIRNEAIHSEHPRTIIFEMVEEEIDARLDGLSDKGLWDNDETEEAFMSWLNSCFPVALKPEDVAGLTREGLIKIILERIEGAYQEKEAVEDPDALRSLERYVVIRAIDRHWQNHLTEMEELRRSVGLRSYGQKDPLNEYKSEAFVYFQEMLASARTDMCRNIFRSASNLTAFNNMLSRLNQRARATGPGTDNVDTKAKSHPRLSAVRELPKPSVVARAAPKVGRNDVCPCGSGKKYKKCCGAAVLS